MSTVTLLDTTLRDGSHAVSHQHSISDTTAVVSSLASAGVEVIEVAHGDGLGGSSVHFGIGRESDLAHIDAAVAAAGAAKICALVVPGLGTADGIRAAAARGLGAVRVATHVTEANLARPHLAAAKDAGLLAIGFLMMTHMAPPAQVAERASELESYGAEVVYLADSAGHQIVEDVARRVEAIVSRLEVAVGVHTHNNLGLAIANALAAAQAAPRTSMEPCAAWAPARATLSWRCSWRYSSEPATPRASTSTQSLRSRRPSAARSFAGPRSSKQTVS